MHMDVRNCPGEHFAHELHAVSVVALHDAVFTKLDTGQLAVHAIQAAWPVLDWNVPVSHAAHDMSYVLSAW